MSVSESCKLPILFMTTFTNARHLSALLIFLNLGSQRSQASQLLPLYPLLRTARYLGATYILQRGVQIAPKQTM